MDAPLLRDMLGLRRIDSITSSCVALRATIGLFAASVLLLLLLLLLSMLEVLASATMCCTVPRRSLGGSISDVPLPLCDDGALVRAAADCVTTVTLLRLPLLLLLLMPEDTEPDAMEDTLPRLLLCALLATLS